MPNLFFGFCRNGASPPNPSQCAHWDTFHLAWKTLRAVEDASPYDEDEADARLHGKLERFLISNSEFRTPNSELRISPLPFRRVSSTIQLDSYTLLKTTLY